MMKLSLFSNKLKIVLFIGGFVLLSLFQALAFKDLGQAQPTVFFIDWITYMLGYSGLSVLLWYTVKYSGKGIGIVQSVVNHLMLIFLFVALSNGWAYLFFDLYELTPVFLDSLGVRLFSSSLIYIIIFQTILERSKIMEVNTVEPTESEIQEEDKSEKISEESVLEHVAVKQGQKVTVIPVEDILFLQAEGDYVMIYTAKNRYLKEQTMKTFESELPKNRFIRVHRSYIVNVEAILGIETNEKQQHLLLLKGGYEVKTSISGYKMLKSQLKL